MFNLCAALSLVTVIEFIFLHIYDIVLTKYGSSEMGANLRNNLCYFLDFKAFDIRSRAVTNREFFFEKPIFRHACATWLSHHLT